LRIRVGVPLRARLSLVENGAVNGNSNRKIAIGLGAFRVFSLTHLKKLTELLMDAPVLFEPRKRPAEFDLSPLTRSTRSSNGEQWLTVVIVSTAESRWSMHCSFYCSRLHS